jgi:hypothetical protein
MKIMQYQMMLKEATKTKWHSLFLLINLKNKL